MTHERQSNKNIQLETPEGLTASINLQGAFVESLNDPDGQELLFPRQGIAGKDRDGIPICAPIFGRGTAVGLAQHGFARNLSWERILGDSTGICLDLAQPGEQDATLTTGAYRGLEALLTIQPKSLNSTSSIEMFLALFNNGPSPVVVAPGFHPYFPIGDIDGNLLIESGDKQMNVDPGQLAVAEVLSDSGGRLAFSNGIHDVTITTDSLSVPVVWTADPDKYICVEPTHAGAVADRSPDDLIDGPQLAPGSEQTYSMRIDWTPIR